MTLCSYDFQKSTIISLSIVTIILTIGLLIQYAHGQTNQTGRDTNILNNGIVAPNDPEISCNKMNSNCHYIFKNETVKITEELFKACTISKDSRSYGSFLVLNNSINCNPVIDYYIGHNWQSIGELNGKITMVLVIAKCDYSTNCILG